MFQEQLCHKNQIRFDNQIRMAENTSQKVFESGTRMLARVLFLWQRFVKVERSPDPKFPALRVDCATDVLPA